MYDHEEYVKADIERHQEALGAARDAGMLNGYGGWWLGVSECGSVNVAKRILTRAPRVSLRGCWNLAAQYKVQGFKLLDDGFDVKLILREKETDLLVEVDFEIAMYHAKLTRGRRGLRNGCSDFYQFRFPWAKKVSKVQV